MVNEVHVIGRVSGEPRCQQLPSGDEVVTWRLVVPRSSGSGVDTIDCAAWSTSVRRRAERLTDGSHVEVNGELRRRFWRTATGAASRYEVEVQQVRRARASGP